MKKISETYKELFPIEIKDGNGNVTYSEDSEGWCKHDYDTNGNCTYSEWSDGYWSKIEYDTNGNVTYYENSSS